VIDLYVQRERPARRIIGDLSQTDRVLFAALYLPLRPQSP